MGYLSRMTQWKVTYILKIHRQWDLIIFADVYDQSKLSLSEDTSALDEKAKAALKLGLFSYPVLQAADIMVHR